MISRFVVLSAFVTLTACSEARGVDTADSGTSTSSGAGGSGATSSTTSSTGGNGGAEPLVILNELSPFDDWVELVNAGPSAIDVSGSAVADLDPTTQAPKLAEAARFPSGTVLSPNAYALVQGGGVDCTGGPESYCISATWSVGHKNGETIYLLDPADRVVTSVVYPPNGAATGSSWGRLPNADPAGEWQEATPTPGAANVQ